ncbi:MAG: NAD(P)/FAD-dependent oxidoreductase [bacterium]
MNRADVVIIGAGPAGIATAIQLKRYKIEPELLEQEEIGGLLRNAHWVENYPGFPEGISGLALVGLFKKQLEKTGIRVHSEKVLELDYQDGLFLTKTDCREITSLVTVIATGTKSKKMAAPPIPTEVECHFFYEVHPLLGIQNKIIAIIGGGDAAFDYACSLAQRNRVIILNRSAHAKCVPALQERTAKSGNVEYMCDTRIRTITRADSRVLLMCARNHEQEELRVEADDVVVAIGREASLDFVSPELRESFGHLRSAQRLHLVGDVNNGIYRQTAISIGDGLRAAMEIHKNIASHRI